ncbi:GGDEF domain-containing protein [Clostridium sardiniense]|uniref:GGDEF domain-containing protein n=1 Tax=Clostridium sardiniense TaxID=29369 RepID=A0ABS7KZM0_CLOSR|nr:GGDEF domain-containing protein [Clostridium sardiniense]MBY0756255.1 GGDEF domain-containing protein [Clostridium sardiniense]MDQ0458801.1 diguanylate cyclase (GGDEF)-like protein [Clostridium sardiniense]
MDLLNDIKNRLCIFKDFYDTIRLVDPINDKVLHMDSKTNVKEYEDLPCHAFWNKNIKCKHCISLKAYNENKTFVKIELKENKIFLVTATPIINNETTYVVELIKDVSKNSFLKDKSDCITIENLLSYLSETLNKDELTNIYNKRVIYERLSKSLSSDTSTLPLSIIMLDIDHFKNINDTYGHLIGDKVLKEFSSVVSSCLRKKDDYFGRFGGEEFMIILENTPLDTANLIAERIREKIESNLFSYKDISIRLTCSLGGYTINDLNIDIEDFIQLADENLYLAKNNGRNNTIFTSNPEKEN